MLNDNQRTNKQHWTANNNIFFDETKNSKQAKIQYTDSQTFVPLSKNSEKKNSSREFDWIQDFFHGKICL